MPPRGRMSSCGKLLLIFLVGFLIGLAGATAFRNKTDVNNITVSIDRNEEKGFASQMRASDDVVDGAVHRAVRYLSSRFSEFVSEMRAWADMFPLAWKYLFLKLSPDQSAGYGIYSERGKPPEIPEGSKRVDRNSDQENLKDGTRDFKLLTGYEVAHFKNEVEKLRDRIDVPSRANMMRRAITDAKNISNPFEERSWALYKLLFLLEDSDDAYNFHKLGGVDVVIQALNSSQAELRAISAWILGKACQISFYIKEMVLWIDPLPILMKMMQSSILDESVKALSAVSDIIVDAQDKFYSEYNGALVLQEIMSNSSAHIRLRRKSSFIADLAEFHLENTFDESPFTSQSFLKSLVDLIRSSDFYLQRKGLLTFKQIHSILIPVEADKLLKDFDLHDALEMMRKELDDLVGERKILGNTFIKLEKLHRDVWKLFPERFKRPTSQDQKGHQQTAKVPRPNPVEMD